MMTQNNTVTNLTKRIAKVFLNNLNIVLKTMALVKLIIK